MEVVCFRCGERIPIPDENGVNRCSCGDVTVFKKPDGVEVAHRQGAEYEVERRTA